MSDTKLRPEDLTSEERAFNKLTPTQTELLALLSEECGEVVQVIGKILRHGLESFHPNGGPTNRELLAEEIGDCLCASRLLASAGMLNMASVEDRSAAKMEKVFRYLHHARRALFAPAPEKVAKVECPNCGEMTSESHADGILFGAVNYTCQPAQPEPAAPVLYVCPSCNKQTATKEEHVSSRNRDSFTCQPAPPESAATVAFATPEDTERERQQHEADMENMRRNMREPAAREMPEAVRDAVDTLRSGVPSYPTWRQYADALESWWRNLAQPVASSDAVAELVNVTERTINKLDRTWDQFFAPVRGAITTVREQAAQPVAVGMTEELEHVLSIAERDLRYKEECFDDSARTVPDERIERLRAAIAAVREQFGKRPKLEKVRGALSWLKMQYEPGSQGYTPNATVWKMTEAALAELDAAEGKGEGRG